jgi:hypothetical protein
MTTTSVSTAGKIRFPKTLIMLNALRQEKQASEQRVFDLLNHALLECSHLNELTLFKRVLLHIGDISRQHELLRKLGIKSPNGGSQERAVFRKILKWWSAAMPESFVENLNVFVNFTVYENIMYYELRSDRYKGTILNVENNLLSPQHVWKFLADKIAKKEDLTLIARHLPSFSTKSRRIAQKEIKDRRNSGKPFKWSFPENRDDSFWVKKNGEIQSLEDGFIMVSDGDILTYPRKKQSVTLQKEQTVNDWIIGFCGVMGWTISDYKRFRSIQNTPEQMFSSKSILDYTEEQVMSVFDTLSSGQRFRVHGMLLKKQGSIYVPNTKWGKIANLYLKWEKQQENVAQEIRNAQSEGDEEAVKALSKNLKVKATGQQTVELMKQLFKGADTAMIDTTYTALVAKIQLEATVFPIIDGSGSMDCGFFEGMSPRQIAYTLAITFSTLNPVEKFRNTYGWFSTNFHIVGPSKFKNLRPNSYVQSSRYMKQVDTELRIDAKYPFSKNYSIMAGSDPEEVASTNLWAVVDYFTKLVEQGECNVEDLPNCLLFLTDTEYNTGSNTKEAMDKAYSIGWSPLVVMWCIGNISITRMNDFANNIPNLLFVNGYNEGVITQVLRQIRTGSINPDDELYALSNDIRYSVIQ